MTTRTGRAAPLAPAERRAAILDATIPLLLEHGTSVRTRQIADACGVAEGTIFSVFPDKPTLIAAAVDAALDPAPVADAIAATPAEAGLDARVLATVTHLQVHVGRVGRLLTAIDPEGGRARPRHAVSDAVATQVAAITALLEPVAGELSRSPAEAAQALFALTLGCSHPTFVDPPVPPEQIAALLLDGVRRPSRRGRSAR